MHNKIIISDNKSQQTVVLEGEGEEECGATLSEIRLAGKQQRQVNQNGGNKT